MLRLFLDFNVTKCHYKVAHALGELAKEFFHLVFYQNVSRPACRQPWILNVITLMVEV
jgi:hypothetical protein